MSYEKKINIDPATSIGMEYLSRYNIEPIVHDLRACMPPGHKEPEKKILVERPKDFQTIRAIFLSSLNCFLVLDQDYSSQDPLLTANVDTVQPHARTIGQNTQLHIPTAKILRQDANLRLRAEINPLTGETIQRDWNEKSLMRSAQVIKGIANRDERETELPYGESLKDGFDRFRRMYREQGSPTYADRVGFEELRTYSGIMTARSSYALAFKHPNHNVLFVFEVCEDRFDTLQQNLQKKTASLHEWEMEPKQVIGRLPSAINTPERFQEFLYGTMDGIGDYLVSKIPRSSHNYLSKAEIASAHIAHLYGDCEYLIENGIRPAFNKAGQSLLPQQFALLSSDPLEEALGHAWGSLRSRAIRLGMERAKYIAAFSRPHMDAVGSGIRTLHFESKPRTARPVEIVLAA